MRASTDLCRRWASIRSEFLSMAATASFDQFRAWLAGAEWQSIRSDTKAIGSDSRYGQLAFQANLVMAATRSEFTSQQEQSVANFLAKPMDQDCALVTRLNAPPIADASPVPGPPRSGDYLDGSRGSKHYAIGIQSGPGDGVDGYVELVAPDGSTSLVFTFYGSATNSKGTLHPVTVASSGPGAVAVSQPPDNVPVTYTEAVLQLPACTAYLRLARSVSQCSFVFSPDLH